MNHRKVVFRLSIILVFSTTLISCDSKPIWERKAEEIIYREYWDSGEVKKEITYNNDTVQSGIYREFYEDGALKVKAYYCKDSLCGEFASFYQNGQKKVETEFRNGRQNGIRKEWHESGLRKGEFKLLNGNRYRWAYYYDEQGELDAYQYYDNFGNLIFTAEYFNGRFEKILDNSSFALQYTDSTISFGDSMYFYVFLPRPPGMTGTLTYEIQHPAKPGAYSQDYSANEEPWRITFIPQNRGVYSFGFKYEITDSMQGKVFDQKQVYELEVE